MTISLQKSAASRLLLFFFLLITSGPPTLSAKQPQIKIPLRVCCGGPSVGKPGSEDFWQTDRPFATAGEDYTFSDKISSKGVEGAAPAEVYQNVRRDDPAWHFRSVPNGLYVVRLHFSDAVKRSNRRMNFWFQDEKLIDSFSVIKAAGGPLRAFVREVTVRVSHGKGLKIRASKGTGDDAFVAGIEILKAPKGSEPTPPVDEEIGQPTDLAARIRAFTGGATRIVWTRLGAAQDIFGERRDSQLFGFDTEDGRGERCIMEKPDSYARPLISPDGTRIVFSNLPQHRCYVMNFDGSGLREFAEGFAACTWTDPKTREPWVCVREKEGQGPTQIIVRRKLDKPEVSVRIWTTSDGEDAEMSHFGLMSDGIHAVDCNPWPNIGTIDLEQSRYHFVANGCWPSVSPDESGRFFTFRGNHRSIWMFNKLKSEGTAVQLDTISDAPGPTVYHPRWTNHPQVITVTAPLGHPQSKLYLGKFDSSFANIDSWRRITYADKPDAFGNAWIATGITATAPPKLISQTKETIEEPATAQRQGLVFIWENQRADNAIIDEHGKTLRLCRATFHGHARPSPTQGGDLRDGALVADDESSRSIALAAAKSNAMTLNFVTQTNEGTRDGVIASYGSPGQPAALLVEQKNSQLHATITATGGTFSIALGQVQPGTPQHWSLVLDASGLHAFQNGKPTASTEAKLNLSSWQPAVLRFGQASDGSGTWRGWIEEIELYDRPLGEKEVAAIHASAAADWAKRKPAPRIVVEAELVEASKTPDPANIRPYQRSLAENLYRVKKVISGELKEDRIIVLQWCILDSQKIEASRSPGTVVTLTLEADEDHTELGGENRSSDLIDPGLPVLYDVGS